MTIRDDHATPTLPAPNEKPPMNPSTSEQPLYPQATRELHLTLAACAVATTASIVYALVVAAQQ